MATKPVFRDLWSGINDVDDHADLRDICAVCPIVLEHDMLPPKVYIVSMTSPALEHYGSSYGCGVEFEPDPLSKQACVPDYECADLS